MNTIDREDAEEIYWGEDQIAKQFVAEHRWSNTFLIVFERDGELWGFYYDEPATEMQEGNDPFDYDDPVSVFPIIGKEVTKIVYEKADV